MARVTVVNDSEEFLSLMGEILSEFGHEMIGLQAVKTGMHELLATEPDLLIVDLVLGNTAQEVSGWELLLLARSHRALRDVPIILCTADVWELKQRALDLERIADVHVRTKPFDLEDLSRLIERLLNPPALEPSEASA